MAVGSITVDFEVDPDSVEMLNTITERCRLHSSSKALKYALDFIVEADGGWDLVLKKISFRGC